MIQQINARATAMKHPKFKSALAAWCQIRAQAMRYI